MKTLIIHWFICFFLLSFHYLDERRWLVKRPSFQFPPQQIFIMEKNLSYLDRPSQQFISALVLGDQKKLPKDVKGQIRSLGVNHAITPSGLHLSLIHPILNLIPSSLILSILYFGFFTLSFNADFYFALSRCILFYSIKHLSRYFEVPLKSDWIFYATFLIDLALGSYQKSPLSFIFSYLFWGTIILSSNLSRVKRIVCLFFCFCLVNLFQGNSISILYLILNPLISFSLAISFIFLLACMPLKLTHLLQSCAHFNLWLIQTTFEIQLKSPMLEADLVCLFLISLFIFKKKWQFVFLFLLLSSNLNNEKSCVQYTDYTKVVYRSDLDFSSKASRKTSVNKVSDFGF